MSKRQVKEQWKSQMLSVDERAAAACQQARAIRKKCLSGIESWLFHKHPVL